jgi:hypothetical protein
MKLYNFKQQLVRLINTSQLTVEEVFYVMKDLLNEVTQNYNQQIDQYRNVAAALEASSEQNEQKVEEEGKKEEE